MNIFYYFLGGIVFIIFNILYDVFRFSSTQGGLVLNWGSLLQYAILGLLAALAFFIADYSLFKKKS